MKTYKLRRQVTTIEYVSVCAGSKAEAKRLAEDNEGFDRFFAQSKKTLFSVIREVSK